MTYIQPAKTNFEDEDEFISSINIMIEKYPNEDIFKSCKEFILSQDDTTFNSGILTDVASLYDKYPGESEIIMRISNYIIDNTEFEDYVIDETSELKERLSLLLSLEKMIVK